VAHFFKPGKGLSSHPLGGRIGRYEIGKQGFKFDKLVFERIEGRVRYVGAVKDVIEIAVMINLSSKLRDAIFRLLFGNF
jgi:hypothetical protein